MYETVNLFCSVGERKREEGGEEALGEEGKEEELS